MQHDRCEVGGDGPRMTSGCDAMKQSMRCTTAMHDCTVPVSSQSPVSARSGEHWKCNRQNKTTSAAQATSKTRDAWNTRSNCCGE